MLGGVGVEMAGVVYAEGVGGGVEADRRGVSGVNVLVMDETGLNWNVDFPQHQKREIKK